MHSKANLREFLIASVTLLLALVFARRENLLPVYLPFFYHESSESFMQFVYFLKALREGHNLFWDTFTNLGTQAAPQTPIFSPVTWFLLGTAQLLQLKSATSLATLFALVSYWLQILAGLSFFYVLRTLSLSMIASLVGAVLYTANFFSSYFGINQGIYRPSALVLIPPLFLGFYWLFQQRRWNFPLMILTSGGLGLCWLVNGDVKPTMHFVLFFSLMALVLGGVHRGWFRSAATLALIGLFSVGLAGFHFITVYDQLREGVKMSWTSMVSNYPLVPDNAILGFSQNPASLLLGFFFPQTFFENFKTVAGIGISQNWGESRLSFTLPFAALALLGLALNRRRRLWGILLLASVLFVLGSSTPLAPVIGWVSEWSRIRYPTRASIVVYFFLSLLAAYGVDACQTPEAQAWLKKARVYWFVYAIAILLPLILPEGLPGLLPSISNISAVTTILGLFLAARFFLGKSNGKIYIAIAFLGFCLDTTLFGLVHSPVRRELISQLVGLGFIFALPTLAQKNTRLFLSPRSSRPYFCL